MADKTPLETVINTSGNSFHCRVLQYLQNNEWKVIISPYYSDNYSDKPREIDLIAEKPFPLKRPYFPNLTIRLFIECKYFNDTTVVWFHDKDLSLTENLIQKEMNIPKNNEYRKNHHYLSESASVAKLFASGKNNLERDPLYKALNQCLNAMIYFRQRKRPLIESKLEHNSRCLDVLNYPVIFCDGFENFHRIDIGSNTHEPKSLRENFLLEINYAYIDAQKNSHNEYFLIDVVDYKKTDEFLCSLQQDINWISNFVQG
jgi:hypothetical protein